MKFPFMRPQIPPVEAWTPHLAESYARRHFTNFGPAEQRLTAGLRAEFAREGECCVLCSNATVGLTAALVALDVRGLVAVPAFTFPATLDAVYAARCVPVICDVDPATWELSPDSVISALDGRRPAAIMPVRAFGLVRDFTPLAQLAERLGAALVVDAAAALGVPRIPQRQLGGRVVEVFSMHATKSFGIGEGGVLFGPSTLEEPIKRALNFGLTADRSFGYGGNGKMSDFQAAVGLEVLKSYRGLLDARRTMIGSYLREFGDGAALRTAPDILASTCSTFPALLPVEANADAVAERALAKGALLRRYYHPSLTEGFHEAAAQPATPVANDLASRMICLPVYADARPEEIDELMQIIKDSLREAGVGLSSAA